MVKFAVLQNLKISDSIFTPWPLVKIMVIGTEQTFAMDIALLNVSSLLYNSIVSSQS